MLLLRNARYLSRDLLEGFLRPGDAAIAFSHSGKSMDTVKALRLAQKAGAGGARFRL